MNRKTVFVVIFFILIILAGCGTSNTSKPIESDIVDSQSTQEEKSSDNLNNEANETVNSEANETVNIEEDNQDSIVEQPEAIEDNKPEFVAPLTGLPVDEEVKNRIIGIIVNNHPKARPQTGLNKADMVYEVLAEGMITRFVAIYQSNSPDVIGSVRSIRPYYLDIINGFDALIVHAGASTDAYAILQSNTLPDLDEISNAGGAFWRVDFRDMPHNVYTSIEKIESVAEKRGFRLDGYIPTFNFLDENEEITGEVANEITIKYYSNYLIEYAYDKSTKLYNRFVNGEPHTDLATEDQLTAKNILVLRADHKVYDDEGRKEIDVYGPGKGYLFQGGVMKEITWKRKDGVIRAYIDDEEQGLLPGQTWTIIVQPQTKVSYW